MSEDLYFDAKKWTKRDPPVRLARELVLMGYRGRSDDPIIRPGMVETEVAVGKDRSGEMSMLNLLDVNPNPNPNPNHSTLTLTLILTLAVALALAVAVALTLTPTLALALTLTLTCTPLAQASRAMLIESSDGRTWSRLRGQGRGPHLD